MLMLYTSLARSMDCNKILVLSEGKVAEFASPAELLEDKVRWRRRRIRFLPLSPRCPLTNLHPLLPQRSVLHLLFHGRRIRSRPRRREREGQWVGYAEERGDEDAGEEGLRLGM